MALVCRTTATTAATRDNLGLSVDVDEDGGVAEGVGGAGMVEPPLGCVGVGGVDVVELSSGCEVLDDRYNRSTNGRPN